MRRGNVTKLNANGANPNVNSHNANGANTNLLNLGNRAVAA
jgi:hypothetical protein